MNYNEIKFKVIQLLKLKEILFFVLALIDVVAGIITVVKTENYYSIFVFVTLLVYFLYEGFSMRSLLKKENYHICEMTTASEQRSYLGYSMANSKIYKFKINKIDGVPFILSEAETSDDNKKEDNKKEDDPESSFVTLQFSYEYKISDLKREKREDHKKFKDEESVVAVFKKKKNKTEFDNSTLLLCKSLNSLA